MTSSTSRIAPDSILDYEAQTILDTWALDIHPRTWERLVAVYLAGKYAATPAQPAREWIPELIFTLREAIQLVATFGGDDTEMTVRKLPVGAVKDDPDDPVNEGPSPAGLWAHCTEYPEEGCVYLGPCEVDDANNSADRALPPPPAADK